MPVGKNKKTKTENFAVTDVYATLTIPNNLRSASFTNIGANDIHMRINKPAGANNFITIKPAVSKNKISVGRASTINVKCASTLTSTLDIIWED